MMTLADVARDAASAALAQAFFCWPARVEKYDAATNTCTAQILVPNLIDAPSGQRPQDFQPLENVPVMQLRAGKVSFIVTPEAGDLVLLLCADRSLDLLLTTGQTGEPGDPRRHDLNDAVALPVFFTFDKVPTDAGTSSIGAESSPGSPGLRIHFSADALCLGESAPAFHVALAERVKTEIAALRDVVAQLVTTFNTHSHLVATTGTALAQTGTASPISANLPPTPPVPSPAVVGDVASTTVKVKG